MRETTSTGKKGESIFCDRCIDNDVSCNKAYDDLYGWDFFIEFPPEPKPGVPIDMQPAHLSALVQVKATRDYAVMSRKLKLSNALRMATSAQPFFLVMIHTRRGQEPRIYVRHVWKDFIAQALKAGRIADNQGKTATHRQSIAITFTHGDDHTLDLLPFIKSEIERVGRDYAAAKRQIVDSVGFEDGHGTMQATFELDSDDDMFDLFLGRRESLDLTRLEYTSERFGIPAGEKKITEGPGKFSVEPKSKPATLRLRSGKGDERIVPAEVTHAHLPDDNGGRDRTRVVAACVEIVQGAGMSAASATMTPGKSSLADIELFGTLQDWSNDGPVELLLMIGENRIDLGRIDLSPAHPQKAAWVKAGRAAHLLRRLCAAAMMSDLAITAHEIEDAYIDLEYMAALASDRAAKIVFDPAPDCPPKLDLVMGYMSIAVGDWTLTVLAQRPVVVENAIELRREIFLGPPRLLDVYIEATAAAIAPATIGADYQTVLDRICIEKDVYALGDFRGFIQNLTGNRAT